jgi:hypothetical protein
VPPPASAASRRCGRVSCFGHGRLPSVAGHGTRASAQNGCRFGIRLAADLASPAASRSGRDAHQHYRARGATARRPHRRGRRRPCAIRRRHDPHHRQGVRLIRHMLCLMEARSPRCRRLTHKHAAASKRASPSATALPGTDGNKAGPRIEPQWLLRRSRARSRGRAANRRSPPPRVPRRARRLPRRRTAGNSFVNRGRGGSPCRWLHLDFSSPRGDAPYLSDASPDPRSSESGFGWSPAGSSSSPLASEETALSRSRRRRTPGATASDRRKSAVGTRLVLSTWPTPSGRWPWHPRAYASIGSMRSTCGPRSPAYHAADDHRQSVSHATSPRCTGLA